MAVKRVAIVGSHVRTREYAPWDRKYINIWVFNEAVSLTMQGQQWVKRCDALFQMHKPVIWKNPRNRNDPKHYEWLQREQKFPIYMLDRYDDVPSSVKYPLDEVCQKLIPNFYRGQGKKRENVRYFTSGPAYAIALAGFMDYEVVDIYGVEMETNTEYTYQRDAVYFWVGVLQGRGIEVNIHPMSNLFRAPLYGYEGDAFVGKKEMQFRAQEWGKRLPQMEANLKRAHMQQRAALNMALKGNTQQDVSKAYFASIKQQVSACRALGECKGALEENERYIKAAEEMEQASGGEHQFSRQEFEQVAAKGLEVLEHLKQLMAQNGAMARNFWKELHEEGAKEKPDNARINDLSLKYGNAHIEYLKSMLQYGHAMGASNENQYYLHRIDELVKAAGGEKSEAVMVEAREAAYAQAL